MGRKKLTKTQIKAKAKAAAKRMTRGKINTGVAIGGPAIRRAMLFAENKNSEEFVNGMISDQTGLDITTGEFDIDNLKRGYSGAITHKIEKILFKAAGVKGPKMKIKTAGDMMDNIAYEGAAVGAAMTGGSPRDKFQRYYEVAYGHNLQTNENQLFKTATRKWLPYILQKKIRQWLR